MLLALRARAANSRIGGEIRARREAGPRSDDPAKTPAFDMPRIEPLAKQKHEGQRRDGDCQRQQHQDHDEP
jgi:hypothetical protein